MGQITIPAAPGITVLPVDRQTGPSAGPGNTGNDVVFFGANAGKNNIGNNSIAIGNAALSGGNQNTGAITIGVNAEMNAVSSFPSYPGPDIVIGENANAAAQVSAQNIIIGTSVYANNPTADGGSEGYNNVLVGNYIAQNFGINYPNNGGITGSVVIGSQAMGGPTGTGGSTAVQASIVIGSQAIYAITEGVDAIVSGSTVIGSGSLASFNAGAVRQSVLIGDSILSQATATAGQGINYTVGIGGGVYCSSAVTPENAVTIGGNAPINSYSVCLGAGAGIQANTGNDVPVNSIYIGAFAGWSGVNPANVFLVENSDQVTFTNTIMYGRMDVGNLIIGKMPYANRDLETIGTTNALKLTNGTRGSGNPTGGGFFYVSAGALHWVGTSGTDTTLAPA